MSEGKYFFIRCTMTGLVLDVQNGATDPGTPVTPYHQKPDNYDNQLWYTDTVGGCIKSKASDMCLDFTGHEIVIAEFTPGAGSQQWRIVGDKIINTEDGKALDIAANCPDPGARICAWDIHDGPNQQFNIEYVSPEYFYIVSQMHGKVIDIDGADGGAGTRIIMWDKNDNQDDNQLWYENKNGIILSKLNDFAMDCSAGGSIKMQPYDEGNPCQAWIKDGFRICLREDPGRVLDIKGESESSGAKLCAWDDDAKPNQRFSFQAI